MITSHIIREITFDALAGDFHPMMGIVDYLINDKGYSAERIVKFASRSLDIPEIITYRFLFMTGLIRIN